MFTQLVAGVKAYSLGGASYSDKWNTTFGASVFYINYGQLQATDASGNVAGQFRANDYVIQLSAGRRYLEKWHYGGSAKFIQSAYATYTSAAIAIDIGVQYLDTAAGISLSVLAKNMGVQVTQYAGENEELPFDLQVGITKKLLKAPLAFSATIQQVHRFNLLYNDSAFNTETNVMVSGSVPNKVLQHFVFAAHVFISSQLEATIGYNHLRRSDLSQGTTGNGLAGFSAGFAARFNKLHLSFARSSYQRGIAYNQLGLNLMLNKLFGVGRF